MADWAPRVFWTRAAVVMRGDGFTVELDGRPLRSPAKRPLTMPTRAMADAVAAEWAAQVDHVDPLSMPVTRAVNAALDKVAPQHAVVAKGIAEYGETDLLCYRAVSPRELVERQAQAWNPLLDWSAEVLGAPLVSVAGVMPYPQDPGAVAALAGHVGRRDPFELTALAELVGLSGSLILGLAVDMGRLTVEDAWELSRIDEAFQAEQWGIDEDAAAEAEARKRAFFDAHRFRRLISG